MSLKPGKSPSELGLYFYATMMALFGATLGFAYMLSFPAQAFSSQEAYATMLERAQSLFLSRSRGMPTISRGRF